MGFYASPSNLILPFPSCPTNHDWCLRSPSAVPNPETCSGANQAVDPEPAYEIFPVVRLSCLPALRLLWIRRLLPRATAMHVARARQGSPWPLRAAERRQQAPACDVARGHTPLGVAERALVRQASEVRIFPSCSLKCVMLLHDFHESLGKDFCRRRISDVFEASGLELI